MWTRGKDKENPGKFAYELYSDTGKLVERVGNFDTAQDADRAAERAQRHALGMGLPAIPDDIAEMTTDELLAELTRPD